ncbi:MAG TPA: chemotaxis protein CheB [Polyangiaceae bacterium]|jgi:two-component system CheB/CheR fusion protein
MDSTNGSPLHEGARTVRDEQPAYVVGIGASAGGLDALERFFDSLPERTGMAFVVVQHLSPDFRSMMDELLGRHTKLPVRLVENGMPVKPDSVYLIPPGKEMIISGGQLLLSERDKQQELTLPIDVFFRSLAQDCGPRAVAIVLSGGGSDGSRGVRAIHEAGGLVLVQNTESAQFDGMPRTARDAGVAHEVLAPQAMPHALVEHAKDRAGKSSARLPRAAASKLEVIYGMLEEEFGIDFNHYKPSTVTRRIERRLALSQIDDLDQYVARLKERHDEVDLLYRDLLIGVTRFFRNEEAFGRLEHEVLPDLLRRAPRDVPFRAWIAGCATGEEAYSFAITLQEAAERAGGRAVKIFATDVHRGSLERAARGVYDEEALANVPRDRLERYFRQVGSAYQVLPDLRQLIVFAQHNVIKDAPFTRVDLVSCRNLLIYLQPPAQQKALSLFHFALNRGGILFLGPSESPGHLADDYETVDKHWRIYRKFSDVRVPVEARLRPTHASPPAHPASSSSKGPFSRYSLSQLLGTYDALLGEFMPESLLVDDQGELVHAFGGASRFLKPRDGRQGLGVLELVDPALKMVLVGGMKRARLDSAPIVFDGVVLQDDPRAAPYKVTVRRVAAGTEGTTHLLISFETATDAVRHARGSEQRVDLDQVSRDQLATLEAELSSTRENLQAAIEELEAGNEELQASNEELLSSNEELQSTNEELQSVNEELYTVNAEHQRKIAELLELTNDMDNLLASTDVGVIFLDAQLDIRKFTPQIAELFNLVPHDVGRPIETFTHTMHHPGLVDDLRTCLSSGERIEREIRNARGATLFLRILPYRAKGTTDGVVLTIIDVSGLKAAENALFRERYLLDSLLYSVPDAIYFKELRGKFIRVNDAMAARLGLREPREAAGKTVHDLLDEVPAAAQAAADNAVLRGGPAQPYVLEKRLGADGGDEWDVVTRLPMKDQDDRMVGVIGIFRDVTREKRAEETIQEAVRRRDQFLAMLSHELRNPLGAMVTATRLLKMRASDPKACERFVETLDRQSSQMARLLEDLLEASRVTQNKIELRRECVDLRAIAREAVDVVRGFLESRGLTLDVEMDTSPVEIDGDPARLQQIQVNLLNNAAKYTPRGGHVRLSIAREGGDAAMQVRDDGVGIPAEMLETVFDLFVQSGRTLDRSEGGLGVGLTLVRSLVTLHGGTVTATSEGTGKGSTFLVRLPLASRVASKSEPQHKPLLRPPPPRGSRVVIVEDNEDSRVLLTTYLEAAGFQCRAAVDGPSGLALIREARPQVAIVDVGLPGMDGLEVARRVRSETDHAGIYLLALTGYGQADDREAARDAGFDDHLVKPVDLDRLVWCLTQGQGDGRA